jgi:hypothetical protein
MINLDEIGLCIDEGDGAALAGVGEGLWLLDSREADMEVTTAAPLPAFIQATPTGLILAKDLTFEEWGAIGSSFGTALQTAAWCIGDWMVYGERKWGKQLLLEGDAFDSKANRIPSEIFDDAIAATSLDRQTLSQYASVCRKIPMAERRVHLSFGHHRILAPLPTPQRLEWMALLDSESNKRVPTVKRLALSVRIATEAPRVVTEEEITQRGEQAGHDNYVPHLTRLLTVLRKTLPGMTEEQREALRDDSEQLLDLLLRL